MCIMNEIIALTTYEKARYGTYSIKLIEYVSTVS